jgi:hypothetical protein
MKLYNLKHNIIKWSIITIICAAPSFASATSEGFAMLPMIIGIITVAVGYIILNSTEFCYKKLPTKIHLYKSLKIAFIIKISSHIAFFIPFNFLFFIDIIIGTIAISINQLFFSSLANTASEATFIATLSTTLTQAILVSLVVLFVALIIWCFIRIFIYLKPSQANK